MSLYDDVIALSKPYLGPAAQKFIDRQIKGHLDVEKASLSAANLDELAKWVYTSGKLLMDDAKAQELSQKVKALK